MGWYCCSCCINQNWSHNKISCIECRHIRCRDCALTTDNISTQKYNIRLRSAWEADEAYDFDRFHIPHCDRSKCDGSCGLQNMKALAKQARLRRQKDKERRERDAPRKGDEKLKPAVESESERKYSTATASSGTVPEVEEPGDTDFVTGADIRSKGKAKGILSPTGRKKGRVTFAEQDPRMPGY